MAVIALLTDFGRTDYYVGAVQGVLLTRAPDARLLDISHDVEPGDVEGGAFLLGAVRPWLPPGAVVVAVVDPGVGGGRRILAARCGDCVFVAPDNGLLTAVLPAAEIRSVIRPDLFLEGHGQTFHGRDRFAPIAAHLAVGGALDRLGEPVADPVLLDIPPPRRDGATLEGRVAHIDRFGNLVTDLPWDWLPPEPAEVRIGRYVVRRFVDRYEMLVHEEVGALPGSLGTLEMARRDASLAATWRLRRGTAVHVAPLQR